MSLGSRNTIWSKTISWIIICQFLVFDITWANPDIISCHSAQSTLAPALFTANRSVQALVASAIEYYGRAMGFDKLCSEVGLHLYPSVNGQRIDLVVKRWVNKITGTAIIHAKCGPIRIVAQVNVNDGSVDFPPMDVLNDTSLGIDERVNDALLRFQDIGYPSEYYQAARAILYGELKSNSAMRADIFNRIVDEVIINKRTEPVARLIAATLLKSILEGNPDIIDDHLVDITVKTLRTNRADESISKAAMILLTAMLKNRSRHEREIMDTLEAIPVYPDYSNSLITYIVQSFNKQAISAPETILPSTVLAISNIIDRDGLDDDVYKSSGAALAQILIHRPDLLSDVCSAVRLAQNSPKTDRARIVTTQAIRIFMQDGADVPLSSILSTESDTDENWHEIFITINNPDNKLVLTADEAINIVFPQGADQAKRSEYSSIAAIRAKNRIYLETVAPQHKAISDRFVVNESNVNEFTALFKLSWTDFKDRIGKYYALLQTEPEAQPKEVMGELKRDESGLGDLEDDISNAMSTSPSDADIIRQIEDAENILSKEGLDPNVYLSTANDLYNTSIDKSELIKNTTVEALENALNKYGLGSDFYRVISNTLSNIAILNKRLSQKAIDTIENTLKRDGLDFDVYYAVANVIYNIAMVEPDLIKDTTVAALENTFTRDGLSHLVCRAVANTISNVVIRKQDLFKDVYEVYKRLMARGKPILADILKDSIKRSMSSLEDITLFSLISSIEEPDFDWPEILRTIDNPDDKLELTKDDVMDIVFPSGDTPEERAKASSIAAIRAKNRIYLDTVAPQYKDISDRFVVNESNVNEFTALFKMEWPDFIKYMGDYYELLRTRPEALPKDVMPALNMEEGGLGDLDDDASKAMSTSASYAEITRRIEDAERILNKDSLDPDAYCTAAEALSGIAINNPELSRRAMDALERVFNNDRLDSDTCYSVVNVLSTIVINKPELITETTITAIKKVLYEEGLDPDSYIYAADALSDIAINNPKLARKAMDTLEGVLGEDGLNANAYYAAASALCGIARDKPGLITETVITALGKVLYRDGLHPDCYISSANALSESAINNPKLARKAMDTLEGVLDEDGLNTNAYAVAADALFNIVRMKSVLTVETTLAAFERVLQRDGLNSKAYRASALASSSVAKNRPELITETTITALEKVLDRNDLKSNVYYAAVNALSDIAKNKPKLARKAMDTIDGVLFKDGLSASAYPAAVSAISDIARTKSELITETTIIALEKVLDDDRFDSDICGSATDALYNIAKNRQELITETTITALEKVLDDDRFDSDVYDNTAEALSNIGVKIQRLLKGVHAIYKRLIASGKADRADALRDEFASALREVKEPILLSSISSVEDQNENWPIILSNIDIPGNDPKLTKEEVMAMLFDNEKDDRTIAAIKAKNRIYLETGEGGKYSSLGEDLNRKAEAHPNEFIALFKMEWPDFIKYMGEYYEALEDSHHALPAVVMAKQGRDEGGLDDLDDDGSKAMSFNSNKFIVTVLMSQHENTLITDGYDSNVYRDAAKFLADVAVNSPDLFGKNTIIALEKTLNRDGLNSGAYYAVAYALSRIALERADLLRESTITALLKALNRDGLNSNAYVALGKALNNVSLNASLENPGIFGKAAKSAILKALNKDGLDWHAYYAAAKTIIYFADEESEGSDLFGRTTIAALENTLKRDGLDGTVYSAVAGALCSVYDSDPDLITESIITALEKTLERDELKITDYSLIVNDFASILSSHTELCRDTAMTALEKALSTDGLNHHDYSLVAHVISDIAIDNPDLIKDTTIIALEKALSRDGLDENDYSDIATALSNIATNKPELFKDVYAVYKRLRDGAVKKDRANILKENIAEVLRAAEEPIPLSSIQSIEEPDEDWPVILGSIDNHDNKLELTRKEVSDILFPQESDPEKRSTASTIAAIRVKNRIYLETVAPQYKDISDRFVVSESNVNEFTALFKMEWPDFVKYMGDYYELLNTRLEAQPKEVMGELKRDESGLGDLEDDISNAMSTSPSDADIIRQIEDAENVLNTEGLDSGVYYDAARALSNLAISAPTLIRQTTVGVLERALNKDGLDMYTKIEVANALGHIARINNTLITQTTVDVLEMLLNKPGLDIKVYTAAASALVVIAVYNLTLSYEAMASLEGTVNNYGLDNYALFVAINALNDIVINKRSLIRMPTVEAYEAVLNRDGLYSEAYHAAANALNNIVTSTPTLIRQTTVDVLERTLNRPGFDIKVYAAAAFALGGIARFKPIIISQNTLDVLERVLNENGPDNQVYYKVVNALGSIAVTNSLMLFKDVYVVYVRLIASGKTDRASMLKDELNSSLNTVRYTGSVPLSSISSIKDPYENWSSMLSTIGSPGNNSELTKEEIIDIVFGYDTDKRTIAAIRAKNRIYLDTVAPQYKDISDRFVVNESNVNEFTALFKMEWPDFIKYMGDYYELLKTRLEAQPKEVMGELDSDEGGLGDLEDGPSSVMAPHDVEDMLDSISDEFENAVILDRIDNGLAVEVDIYQERVTVIDREMTRRRDVLLEGKFRENGIFEKIRAAQDERLLREVLERNGDGGNFRNFGLEERNALVNNAGTISISFILGHGFVGGYERRRYLGHIRTGRSERLHHLAPTVWIGEDLCDEMTVEDLASFLLEECTHIVKPHAIHGIISDATDPSNVIEHNKEFVIRLAGMAENAESRAGIEEENFRISETVPPEEVEAFIKRADSEIASARPPRDEVTALLARLVKAGDLLAAEKVADKAMRRPHKDLTIREMGRWVDLVDRVSPVGAEKLRALQKIHLSKRYNDKDRRVSLWQDVHVRFPNALSGIGEQTFLGAMTAILEGMSPDDYPPKIVSFLKYFLNNEMGISGALSEREEDLVQSLSLEISRTICDQRKGKQLRSTGELSFRDGMRFKKIFSVYYLRDLDKEVAKTKVFTYFVLVAWSVYGRFIRPCDRERFASLLVNIFKREAYKELFMGASIDRGREIDIREAMDIFDRGRFDVSERESREEASGEDDRLPHENNILAAVERARACRMPAFIFTPAQYFPDAVVRTLSSEADSEVISISMSGFTQRKELFGMYLPDESEPGAEPKMRPGAIARVIEYAEAHPDKRIYFVMENPDFLQGDIRMALHQFLLERKITLEDATDELGRKSGEIAVPDNLQVVLTMDSEQNIGDESFMDRSSGCFMRDITDKELEEYIVKVVGLPPEAAEYLVNEVYKGSRSYRELNDRVTVQDIIQAGWYVAGRVRDNNITVPLTEVTRQEAAMHLESKFSELQDESALSQLRDLLGDVPEAGVVISEDGKSIIFNGIRVELDQGSRFAAFINRKISADGKAPSFDAALLEFLPKDYFLTGIEERTFCLLARVYKYAPSKVVFLQGLPGGGKTTIARVFFDIVGCSKEEYTLNKESDLSMLRGSLGLTPEGLKARVAEYWKKIPEDMEGVIINEADMRLNMVQWLWPEILGRAEKFGWEYASLDEDNPIPKAKFGKGRMMVLTGNVRKDMPPVIAAAMPATYFMERSEEDIRGITEEMFISGRSKVSVEIKSKWPEEYIVERSQTLSDIYNKIARNVREGAFNSKREVTPRQIERFKDLFFRAAASRADIDMERVFNTLLYVVFVAMWDNPEDMRIANGLIRTHITDSSPPLSGKELLDFCRTFDLDIPLLVLTDGTISFEEIRESLRSATPDAKEEIIPLSYFHTKKSLIGGISRTPDDHEAANKLGILPWLILDNHITGKKTLCWMPGYINLNPKVAPVLNEFFQTNWLDVSEVLDDNIIRDVIARVVDSGAYARLAEEFEKLTWKKMPANPAGLDNGLRKEFVRFLIGYKGDGLLIRALGSAGDPIELHPADIDRFFTVNVSEGYGRDWIRSYVDGRLSGLKDAKERSYVVSCIENAYRLYEEEKEEGLYPHNRLSRNDIDIFLDEILGRSSKKTVSHAEIMLLAYHTLGIGFTKQEEDPDEGVHEIDYRASYAASIGLKPMMVKYSRGYVEERGIGIYFVITAHIPGEDVPIARILTRYADKPEEVDEYGRYSLPSKGSTTTFRLQAPLNNLLAQQASAILFMNHSAGVALEGDPGGGKTSGTRDICKATGRQYYEEGMYKWINLGTLIGSLGIRGKDIALNTLDKDAEGRFVLPFLRLYSEGGTFVADEGMVSKLAGRLLKWMAEVSRQDEIDLGTYHPGLQGVMVKRHPEFSFAITQNEHFKTKGRRPMSAELDRRCGKIHVDNILSLDDAKLIVDYYAEVSPVDGRLREDLARLHLLLTTEHPAKRMISPRDLIDTVLMIRYAVEDRSVSDINGVIFEALSISYLEGLSDPEERDLVENLIREVFKDFTPPDYSDVTLTDRSHSDVEDVDIAHLLESKELMNKAKAFERMLEAGMHDSRKDMPPSRQVLLVEEPGASGMGFLKMFSNLTGRKLETIEGHPFLTARLLLTGDSFEFEPEFDRYGHRKIAKGENGESVFKQTHGAIRRHLVKEEMLSSVPEAERVPLLLAITNVESIPKNELVKLNELIATREITLKDDEGKLSKFKLPDWVTIVPITSDMAKLTSPFANRFRKLGLAAPHDTVEVHAVLSKEFPNVTIAETEFLMDAVSGASELCADQKFELGYDFNMGDINEMALRIQMYKQHDAGKRISHADPFWYPIRAITYVYLQAMCPEDRDEYIKYILQPMLLKRLPGVKRDQVADYLKDLINNIRVECRAISPRYYPHSIHVSSMEEKTVTLPNGMMVKKNGDAVTIISDSKAYKRSWEKLGEMAGPVELSPGLTAAREGDILILNNRLISEIGINRLASSPENMARSLPMEEMGMEEFMYPADALVDALNSLLEAQTLIRRTATGRTIRPRVVFVAGGTGSGKTTIPKMLSKAEGTPQTRVNPWRQMQGSKITVSLSFGQTVEMTISDFLLSCGKIRLSSSKNSGEHKDAAYPTSNRMRILVDEANVTSDAWYILDAIARGEKKFLVETPAGDAVEVELDNEVDIILTYNPPERYGGTGKGSNRYKFPQALNRKAVKIYLGEPLEEYSEEEMHMIMKEVYRRGEASAERSKTVEELGAGAAGADTGSGGFYQVSEDGFDVERVNDTESMSMEELSLLISERYETREADGGSRILTEEEAAVMLKAEAEKYDYSEYRLREYMNAYTHTAPGLSVSEKYLLFVKTALREALKGLAAQAIGSDLLDELVGMSNVVDVRIGQIINDIARINSQEEISEMAVKAVMARLERLSAKYNVYLEGTDATMLSGGVLIGYEALTIARKIDFDIDRIREVCRLPECDYYNMIFGDHEPEVIVANRPPDGQLGYFDGKDAICSSLNDRERELEVASHELGHKISDMIADPSNLPNDEFTRSILERIRLNVELYSTLFPFILANDPRKYATDVLLEMMKGRADEDDAYALAAAHVLDAFAIEFAMDRIGDTFDINKAKAIIKAMDKYSDADIARIAIKFWKNPKDYFPNVKKGHYYRRVIEESGGAGGKIKFTLSDGPAVPPRVKTVGVERSGLPQNENRDVETGKKLIRDSERRRSGPAVSQAEELPPSLKIWMKKYEELFASDEEDEVEVRYVSEGGTDINPEAWHTRNADELLIAPQYEDENKSLAQNVMFVIDVSGSIRGAADVQEAIENMIRTYASFLLELSRKNADLNVSIATISNSLNVLFDFNDWKKARSHAAKRELILDGLAGLWESGDGGGINSTAMLDGLTEVEFPSAANKDSKNLVVVFTDGQECGGRAVGGELKGLVSEFSQLRYSDPQGKTQIGAGRGNNIDMAFVGALLEDGGEALREHYPCYLNVGEESADAYVEALFKMAYMQAKGMPLEGDLSETVRTLGHKAAHAGTARRAMAIKGGMRSVPGMPDIDKGGRKAIDDGGGTAATPEAAIAMRLSMAEKTIRTDGLNDPVYMRAVEEISKIIKEQPSLATSTTVESLKTALYRDSDISPIPAIPHRTGNRAASDVLADIVLSGAEVSGRAFDVLIEALDDIDLGKDARSGSAMALSKIAINDAGSLDRVVNILLNVFSGEGSGSPVLPAETAALINISTHNIDLAVKITGYIEELFYGPGPGETVYFDFELSTILSVIATTFTALFGRIYNVYANCEALGNTDRASKLKERLESQVKNYNSAIPLSAILSIEAQEDNWPIILGTIHDPDGDLELDNDEVSEIVFGDDSNGRTIAAIKAKNRIYVDTVAPQQYYDIEDRFVVNASNVNEFTALFKMEWPDFVKYMGDYYELLKTRPEALPGEVMSKRDTQEGGLTDLSSVGDVINAEKPDPELMKKLKSAERRLKKGGLDPDIYRAASDDIVTTVRDNPSCSREALRILERILKQSWALGDTYEAIVQCLLSIAGMDAVQAGAVTDAMERVLFARDSRRDAYDIAVDVLAEITGIYPDFTGRTLSVCESVLTKDGLNKNSYRAAAETVTGFIKYYRSQIRPATIDALGSAMGKENIDCDTYRELVGALKDIVLYIPDLARMSMNILEKELYRDDMSEDARSVIYSAFSDIALDDSGDSGIVMSSLEAVLNTPGKKFDVYHCAAKAISIIALKSEPLFVKAVDILDKLLNQEGREEGVYRAVVVAVYDITEKNPASLTSATVNSLAGVLHMAILDIITYHTAAKALENLAKYDTDNAKISMGALETILHTEGLNVFSYRSAAISLSTIAINNPALFQKAMEALEKVMLAKELSRVVHNLTADGISKIPIKKPELFRDVYAIYNTLKASGRTECAGILKESIKRSVKSIQEEIPLYSISAIDEPDENWPEILRSIDIEYYYWGLTREEIENIIFNDDPDSGSVAAIMIKNDIYLNARDDNDYTGLVDTLRLRVKSNVNEFTALFKMEWPDFIRYMGDYYELLKTNPEALPGEVMPKHDTREGGLPDLEEDGSRAMSAWSDESLKTTIFAGKITLAEDSSVNISLYHTSGVFYEIAKRRRDLVDGGMMDALFIAILREGLDKETYESVELAIVKCALAGPLLMAKLYSFISALRYSGRIGRAGGMAIRLILLAESEKMTDSVDKSQMKNGPKDEDWPVILRTIGGPAEEIIMTKDEVKELALGTDNNAKTMLAIKIKHRVYIERMIAKGIISDRREYLTDDGSPKKFSISSGGKEGHLEGNIAVGPVNSFTGLFKMEWDDFMISMDRYYELLRLKPTSLPIELDVGIKDEGGLDDIPEEPGRSILIKSSHDRNAARSLQKAEETLRRERLNPEAYRKAARNISSYAASHSHLIGPGILDALSMAVNRDIDPALAYCPIIRAIHNIVLHCRIEVPADLIDRLEHMVKKNVHNMVSDDCIIAMTVIAVIRPEHKERILGFFESALLKEEVSPVARDGILRAVSLLPQQDESMIRDSFRIIHDIEQAGKGDLAQALRDLIRVNLSSSIRLDNVLAVGPENEDWLEILRNMENTQFVVLTNGEPANVLFGSNRDARTAAAIKAKNRIYLDKVAPHYKDISDRFLVNESNVNEFTALFKMDWPDFIKYMGDYYALLKTELEALPKDVMPKHDTQEGGLPDLYEDVSKAMDVDLDVLRDISQAEMLAKCIKEAMLSRAFDKKLVLAFDDDMDRYQLQHPVKRVIEALNTLKENEAYRRVLSNLIIVSGSADKLSDKLKDYISDNDSRIFLFSNADARENLSRLEPHVKAVYIDSRGFRDNSYYPIAEIVVLSLAQYFEKMIDEGQIAKMIKIAGKDFELKQVNIDSMQMDGPQALIFKLLPDSNAYETGDLIKRYAAVTAFLESA